MHHFWFLLPLFLCCSSCIQRPAPASAPSSFVVSNKPPVKVDAKKTPFTFGYLDVPENRENPTGRTIKLPVYIFKSRSASPAPDPVLYTVGGPGSSSMNAARYMRAYAYLEDRDLILFEQRGTQYAQPHLACPEWSKAMEEINRQSVERKETAAYYTGAAAGCSDRLREQGIDLNAYNTREIAADIEDLRKALNIDRLNLLTISYSTKIAQVMIRDYPNSIRSVVMDSPLPLAASWDESSLTNLMETYEVIFADCAADEMCNTKYPNLKERFFDFLRETSGSPIQLEVDSPDGKGKTMVEVTATDIAAYLGELYTGNAAAFPTSLDAVVKGNREMLRDNYSWLSSNGNGIGMRLSVWCSEETAFADPGKVAAERAKYPFLKEASPMVFSYEVCRAWGVTPAQPQENQPIVSDVPTLLISGSYDAITPVKWANTLHSQLANSQHVIFPGWTHGPTTYWNNSCAMETARAFFNAPNTKSAPPCLEEISLVFE